MLFDTHVHLNDQILSDHQRILEEAKNENVRKMVVVGYDLESSRKAIELANKYKFIYASVGIHPSEANSDYDRDLVELENLITDNVVAIGEIGLDYHYEGIDKNKQKDLFQKQLEIAKKYNLPIIIHSRDACKETYEILKEYKECYKKGIMHCYSYSKEMAKEFSKLGFVFGIGGVVTYKNAQTCKEVVESLSLDRIVLETDAPYLTPVPNRGKINEPKYIKYVAKEIAKIKNLDQTIVENETYRNACEFFGVEYED